MRERTLEETLRKWDEALEPYIQKYNSKGNNPMFQYLLGCRSMIREVLRMMEDDERNVQ